VGQFVVGVVVNVLVHVAVQLFHGIGVQRVATGGRGRIVGDLRGGLGGDFVVLGAGEFLVLQPQVGFQNFRGGQETKNGGVTAVEPAVSVLVSVGIGEYTRTAA